MKGNTVMGMSASQARFLMLTARKNNVEFEGQQINQQRTTLSNESASYYSDLCNMAVPTPPSIDDYTKVSYTFNDGAMTNTIISILTKGKNEYSISYLEQWQDDYSIVAKASSLVQKVGDKYTVDGTSYLRDLKARSAEVSEDGNGETNPKRNYVPKTNYTENDIYYMNTDGNILKYIDGKYYKFEDLDNDGTPLDGTIPLNVNDEDLTPFSDKKADGTYTDNPDEYVVGWDSLFDKVETETNPRISMTSLRSECNDPYYDSLSDEELEKLLSQEDFYLHMLREKYGEDTNWMVRYVKNTTSGVYVPYFYLKGDLENDELYHDNFANINCASIGSAMKTKEILNQKGQIEKDSSGRYVSITLEDGDGNQTTYELTTTTSTDEEAYNDAMNQYNYAQHEYDRRIQEINSKLEIIQTQDKQLELKLKQLDTEENAISTEMDAVKKVISKNVENSFKTFNA